MVGGEYDGIPASTPKVYAEVNGGSQFDGMNPLDGGAIDFAVARVALSWLEVYVVGDARYSQFIKQDATFSAWRSTLP
jgi:hypothetical protein